MKPKQKRFLKCESMFKFRKTFQIVFIDEILLLLSASDPLHNQHIDNDTDFNATRNETAKKENPPKEYAIPRID